MKYRLAFLLFFCTLCCTRSFAQSLLEQKSKYTLADTLRGSLRPERTCYDVTYYDLNVRIDTANKAISGTNKIYFTALADFKTLQLDLFENMNVLAITHNGVPVNYTRQFNAIFVTMDTLIPAGTKSFVTVAYHGKPIIAKRPPWDGGFTWTTDKKGKPWIAVSCEGIGASLWWPCKDYLGDEPDSMKISCMVPAGLRCISNGNQTRETTNEDGSGTFTWMVHYPINNYNVTLNIGDYVQLHEDYKAADSSILSLDYYVLSYNAEKAKVHFKEVQPMMHIYEKYLGKYPFWNDGYALVETPYLGMEHQGAIAYGNQYLTGYVGNDFSHIGLSFDYIIIHETGHEWWGNSVTCKDIADMWIHEGFCTYTESIYVEQMFGNDTAMRYINRKKGGVRNEWPLVGVYGVNEEGNGDMYNKGSLFLNTLRHVFNNDAAWWSTIKNMSDTVFKMKNIGYEDVEKYFSGKSGRDLSAVFEQYLKHKAIPVMEYKLTKVKGKDYTLTYRWQTDVTGFSMPLFYSTRWLTNQKTEADNTEHTISLKLKRESDFKWNEDWTYFSAKKL